MARLDDVDAVPLLDKGTQLAHPSRTFVRTVLILRPTCGEATIVLPGQRVIWEVREAREVDPAEKRLRAGRRTRSAVRRYVRHNGLTELWTFTYADRRQGMPALPDAGCGKQAEMLSTDLPTLPVSEGTLLGGRDAAGLLVVGGGVWAPPELDSVSDDLDQFLRRLRRATGWDRFPYLFVPEYGKETGRLHLHGALRGLLELGAVEVCERCIRPALAEVYEASFKEPIPPAGSFCVGELWGNGFVGRPDRDFDRRSAHGASAYLSKYLAKDLLDVPALFGRQRIRTGQGFRPEPVREVFWSRVAAWDRMVEVMGSEPSNGWSSEGVEDWHAPPVWVYGWDEE